MFLCFFIKVFKKVFKTIYKQKKSPYIRAYSQDGVDGGIRTPDRALRRRMLYPAELRRQRIYSIT